MAGNLYGSASGGEKKADGDKKPRDPAMAQYWREIERYNRATGAWTEEGEQIENIYLDDQRTANSNDTRKFPLLWANVEVLKPAVYAKIPNVICGRRYKD